MTLRYRLLAARIASEVTDLDSTAVTIQRHWEHASVQAVDQDAYLNSVALNLHSWYSGLERLFEAIAVEFDGDYPRSDSWHADLLHQVALDMSPSRPPVLTRAMVDRLDEYRKFRHLIRNIYATNLSGERMASLVLGLPPLWRDVRAQLLSFAEFAGTLLPADPDSGSDAS